MSDPLIREMLDRAFTEHDRFLVEDAESDRRLERLQEQVQANRRQRGEIVRKVYDPSRAATQQHTATMDPATQSRWDQWADQKIKNAIAAERAIMSDAIARMISTIRREWRSEIKKAVDEYRLPMLEGYMPGRFYERGSIVCAGGSVFQANQGTAFSPGHSSWSPIVSCGERGEDGVGVAELNAKLERKLADLELKINALIVERKFEHDNVVDLPNPLRHGNAG